MGQALYRNYRPKSFDEVVGQDHIATTLKRAIKSGRISHAYLFTGPRGVGKTSVARILAHEVNQLPYTDESVHLDIIEIDAASNRRIDEIRELRDKVHISPTSAKYKVYIIDEVHMLTREAFNALLKTLEEPPAHCIFILATTEAHKLPETIVSRTQRFEFKPINPASAAEHLATIAKSEHIKIDKPALGLLAEHGQGSFRDSISLLDQLSTNSGPIGEQDVREFLGLPPAQLINELLAGIKAGDMAAALQTLDELRGQGADPNLSVRLLAGEVRDQLINNQAGAWAGGLLKKLVEVPASQRPDVALEIAVLEACSAGAPGPRTLSASMPMTETRVVAEVPAAEPTTPEPQAGKPAAEAGRSRPKTAAKPVQFDDQAWEEIITRVKDQAASLYTALRLATPEVSEGKLTLAFAFPLHQKKVNQAEHRDLIGQIVAEVTGEQLSIDSVVDKTKASPAPKAAKREPKPKDADPALGTISNIFGKAEVIES